MRKYGLCIGVFIALVLVGCTPLEKVAYETVVAANASIKNIKVNHPECITGNNSSLCVTLTKATAAKDSLIDAAELYCAGPDFNAGGKCDPPAKGTPAATQATAKLQAALAAWNQISLDLKGVK